MNLKTTLVLLVLAAAGAGLFWLAPTLSSDLGLGRREPERADAGTLQVLEGELTAPRLSRIEIKVHSSSREKVELSGTTRASGPCRGAGRSASPR